VPLCFVSIGSNVERERNVRGALRALRGAFGPLLLSSVYETEAIGFAGDRFYNLVAGFFTELSAPDVANALADIETAHGRERGGKRFVPRTLDLDLLLYGDAIVAEPELTLPRPEIESQAFVLEPLAETAPDLLHPRRRQTYQHLWNEHHAMQPTRQVRVGFHEG
jgi:2-amino-4-hydroxy-6-hydroxymethyldihydropteridine diphosphokinase